MRLQDALVAAARWASPTVHLRDGSTDVWALVDRYITVWSSPGISISDLTGSNLSLSQVVRIGSCQVLDLVRAAFELNLFGHDLNKQQRVASCCLGQISWAILFRCHVGLQNQVDGRSSNVGCAESVAERDSERSIAACTGRRHRHSGEPASVGVSILRDEFDHFPTTVPVTCKDCLPKC